MGILKRLGRMSRKLLPQALRRTQDVMSYLPAGKTAPGFVLNSLDKKEYSLKNLMERGAVVAAFFKVSCPVCQFTFPFLERLHKKYGGDGVTIVGVSQDDAGATSRFAKEYGVTFPLLLDDPDGYAVSNAYGLQNVPTIFLIDSEGTIKESSAGFDKKSLEAMAAALAEHRKISLTPFFRPDEVVPVNKPG